MAQNLHDDSYGEEPTLPCVGKLAFDTLREAKAAANVAEYQHGARVRPYTCRFCGLWHLTTS